MDGYIGYIRVSTQKQGTLGVSLQEQREAILRYAERNRFPVAHWLEEIETAAKLGRPVFNQALKLLKQRKARGIILHKLDRGARNLRDWAAIGELSDQGIEVHFVSEGLDLHSRGGRLSADIQAVVAADYIRNLREETRKGFYGRLKQGLYPLRAPIGYVDAGKGKQKTIDPIMGPLVRRAFEMYGTARYSFETLGEELFRLGLRNRHGGRVTKNGLTTLLNNTFYIGIIRIDKTNESFAGIHTPLIGKSLFDRAQAVLAGKINTRIQRHNFLFRRLLTCAICEYSLIGERQKGHVYYRCHTDGCGGTSIREEQVEGEIERLLKSLRFDAKEKDYFKSRLLVLRDDWADRREDEIRSMNLKLGQVKDRLNRLTDAYLDQALDKSMFEQRKESLLLDQKSTEEHLTRLSHENESTVGRLEKFLELAGNAWLSHRMAFPEEKRQIVQILTSNRRVHGKKLELEPSIPFREIVNRSKSDHCDPERDTLRTCDDLLNILTALNEQGRLPRLDATAGFRDEDNDTKEEISTKE